MHPSVHDKEQLSGRATGALSEDKKTQALVQTLARMLYHAQHLTGNSKQASMLMISVQCNRAAPSNGDDGQRGTQG